MPTVLIADDESFIRILLKNILTKNGYEVVGEARDGNEAVEKYLELKPDLVTMDIIMPNTDGITAVKAIKEIDPQAIIVMVSSMGQQVLVKDAIKSGAVDFIIKPFKEEKVIDTLQKALN